MNVALYVVGALLGALGAATVIFLVVWYRLRVHGRLWGFKR